MPSKFKEVKKMKLTGELKEKVERNETKEAEKKDIKGMMEDGDKVLSDDELDNVTGGAALWTEPGPKM